MPNSYFQFKQFTIHQDRCAMKVTTDSCLFGAWVAHENNLNHEHHEERKNVLDIGTGTGLLSLMVAQKDEHAMIDAIEIDKEAYGQSKENAEASRFAKQIRVIEDDIKSFPFAKRYDLIICNPPFYENELPSVNKRKNFAHHRSGLLLQEVIPIMKKNLSPGGRFFLLLPFKRNEEIRRVLLTQDLYAEKILFVRQSTKHEYFRVMIAGKPVSGEGAETFIDEISICNEEQQYTPAFKELLIDYYLNL